jgi:hypothetical protein
VKPATLNTCLSITFSTRVSLIFLLFFQIVLSKELFAQQQVLSCEQQKNFTANISSVIGPLSIDVNTVEDGKGTLVNFLLETREVASVILTPSYSTYTLDVLVGTSTAEGTITSLFLPSNQISTVTADITVTVNGQNPQHFKGIVYKWIIGNKEC